MSTGLIPRYTNAPFDQAISWRAHIAGILDGGQAKRSVAGVADMSEGQAAAELKRQVYREVFVPWSMIIRDF